MIKKITIAIPVYNGEKYIAEAIQSIIHQTVKVDYIIICDNQSTDNTVKIVEQHIDENKGFDIRLFINKTNLGSIRNYNKCIELCHSDYLIILSSDDRFKPNIIEKQLNFLERHPEIAVVGGKVDYIDSMGKIFAKDKRSKDRIFKKGEILELIYETRLWIQHSSVMLQMKYTKNIGGLDTDFIGGDERFWAQVLVKYPIALLGEALVEERRHPGQAGSKEHLRYGDKIMHFETNYKVANYESTPERIREAQKLLNDSIASQAIVVGKSVWKNFGKKQLGVKYWFYGLKRNPNYYFRRYVSDKVKKPIKRILNR